MNSIIYKTYNDILYAYIKGNYTKVKQLSNKLNIYSLSIYLKALLKDNRNIEDISVILQEEIEYQHKELHKN